MADQSSEEKTAEGLPPLHGTALVLLTIAVPCKGGRPSAVFCSFDWSAMAAYPSCQFASPWRTLALMIFSASASALVAICS